MKFSLVWLKDYLNTDADAATIAATLNAIGIEVEDVDDPAEKFAGFHIARVLSAGPHPQADRLQVLSVDAGAGINNGAPLQVVCGAPNARAGLVGVLGLAGAVVPANGMELRKSAIRGVESNGMMCSAQELGLGEDHAGIIELPEDAPLGTAFAQYADASPVFDVAITPNRPDCMGVHGIARDLAAAGLGQLKDRPIDAPADAISGTFACPVEIRTDDPHGCPAFFGRVIRGVKNGPSPDWLQQRLISAGQRPISALVDITNYLMLAYGRPAHAYDLAKVTGPLVARPAKAGETLLALNEKSYALDSSVTVIADDAQALGIAGIMGGETSGVDDDTTDVVLEIAYFNPENIGTAGRKLNLASDARTRFERGVDPQFMAPSLDILTGLILETCGGEASEPVYAGNLPKSEKSVAYDPALAGSLGGVDVPLAEQEKILSALGFSVADKNGASWQINVPSWRPDIDGAPDIVEEVVRIYGLDRIASVPLPRTDGVARPTATPEQLTERRLRRAAASYGLNEAVTWSFLPVAEARHFAEADQDLWLLDNPISEDMKAMRPSLLPGLLLAARRNLDRGAPGVRLFELGRRYLRGKKGISDERQTLAIVLAGEKSPRGWDQRIHGGKAASFDAFDAKALALALLGEAGAPVDKLQVMAPDEAGPGGQFHPGQSATLRLGPKNILARFGVLHPGTLKLFDLEGPVAAVEIFYDAVPVRKGAVRFARPAYAPPALQPVLRDFAFLVPDDLPAGDLLRVVRGADRANIIAARIFDHFRGAGVPEGQKSLALEVTLQPDQASYKEDELKAISDRVIKAAAKLGAVLRG